ncbi:LysR family transcriptional regulator [Neisseriaceae bacterium CLB008]
MDKRFADRLNWSLLHTFMVIVQEGSISKAAVRLHLTQSAVSQSLKRMEAQLGHQLIERTRQKFLLTPLGESCFQAARLMYGEVANLESQITSPHAAEALAGHLKLLVVSRIQSQAYDAFLSGFKQRYPLVSLDIEVIKSVDILRYLTQKTTALGLGLCRVAPDKIEQRLLFNQRYGLYCGRHHPLFNEPNITQEVLRRQDFVAFQSAQIGDVLSPLTVFRDNHGYTGKVMAVTNSLDEVVRLLSAGYGIGCLPDHVAQSEYVAPLLRALLPQEPVATIPVYLLWHKERMLSQVEQRFIEELSQVSFAIDSLYKT